MVSLLVVLILALVSASGAGAESPPLLAAGKYHSAALRSDGTVWTWGSNVNGQLGDATYDDRNSPVQVVGLTGVSSIATGGFHTVAVKGDGTVWAWGNNGSGRLGNNSTTQRNTPVQTLSLTGMTAAAAGYAHTVALKNDGTVWAWGRNLEGQLGTGTASEMITTPVRVNGLSGVIAVASGDLHCIALKSDGTVWTWGENGSGQLGNGGTVNSSSPVQVSGLTQVIAVASGGYHSAALRSDGTVWTWGYNFSGQLGDGTTVDRSQPVMVEGQSGVVYLSAGYSHTLAVQPDGTVMSWGGNSFGQLGDGTSQDKGVPVPVYGLSGVRFLAGGYGHTLAMKNNGQVVAWGNSGFGRLGDGTFGQQLVPAPVAGIDWPLSLSIGYFHSAAIASDGSTWTWGRNSEGQLGDGTTIMKSVPTKLAGFSNFTTVASGGYHTIGLHGDGSVMAWGINSSGQLGDGTLIDRNTPVPVGGLSGVTAIAVGCYHSVALRSDGTVWTWGNNSHGQLGDGGTSDRTVPIQVAGLEGVIAVAAGMSHTVALRSDGTVWAWGYNGYGQLGDGTTIDRATPKQVSGVAGALRISAGCYHTIALRSGGLLQTWGDNSYGQLGDGTFIVRLLPVDVTGVTDLTAVDGGGFHTLAVKSDGSLWAWGKNSEGQLGNGTMTSREVPVQLSNFSGVVAVSGGYSNSTAAKSDGTVWGWGDNLYGLVGDGNGSLLPHNSLINLDALPPVTSSTPSGGAYGESVTVGLSCNDAGTGCSGMYYTIDGTVPTFPLSGTTQEYSSPLIMTGSTTLSWIARDHAGNVTPVSSQLYTVLNLFPLTIQFGGTGEGAVTVEPAPPGISCSSGCSQSFVDGTVVTMTPLASQDSVFRSWSGCDATAGGVCTVTLFSARSVTAEFMQTPSAVISSAPPLLTLQPVAEFSFYSANPTATFECRLDYGDWSACTAPVIYSTLADGLHTFSVRGVDSEGIRTANPPSWSWTVDTIPPDTSFSSTPAPASNSIAGSIGFASSETGSTFECRMDSGAWGQCGNPYAYSNLPNGSHTFEVRATDTAGNNDPTPAAYTWTIDTVAPLTYIVVKPGSLVNQNWGSVSFFSNEPGATFQCKLDSGSYAPCSSPYSFSNLSDGSHVLMIRAVDPAGNIDNSLKGCSWIIDTTPPETTIIAKPSDPSNKVSGAMGFAASEGGSTYECSIDNAAYSSCTTPYFFSGLSNGSHQFKVRAKDPAGNFDPTPAEYSWTIDTVWPDTSILSAPPASSQSGSGSFTFSATESGVSYECSMDSASFTACSNPYSFSGLANGTHNLQVRAKDAAGNLDLSPASFSWAIDAPPPPCNAMTGGACYPDITSAYNSLPSPGSGIILVKGAVITDSALAQREIDLSLVGGYDDTFAFRPEGSLTVIAGSFTVGFGSVVIDAMEIR